MSKRVGPAQTRLVLSPFTRLSLVISMAKAGQPYSTAEETKLENLCSLYEPGKEDWEQILESFPGRTLSGLKNKAKAMDGELGSKGRWSDQS